MIFWLNNIRRFVLLAAFLVAVGLYLYFWKQNPETALGNLVNPFALIALGAIYLALLATPLTQAVPELPGRIIYIKARRAIGVSAFFFGLAHGLIVFFLAGGLDGYLATITGPAPYSQAVLLATAALVILAAMAATSFDYMARLLGTRWKMLHRLVYIAAVSILIHGIIMGPDLYGGTYIGAISFVLIVFLFSLEALRAARAYLRLRPLASQRAVAFVALIFFLIVAGIFYWGLTTPLIHGTHTHTEAAGHYHGSLTLWGMAAIIVFYVELYQRGKLGIGTGTRP